MNPSFQKIFLVGMPGAGKSKLAKQLAMYLGYTFIDVDKWIEEKEQKTIAAIFKKQGATHFRLLEKEAIREISTLPEKTVIATGGGLPCFHDNMSFMHAIGKTVYIDVAIPILATRIINRNNRPLFINMSIDEIKEKLLILFQERHHFYEISHFIIDGSMDRWQALREIFSSGKT